MSAYRCAGDDEWIAVAAGSDAERQSLHWSLCREVGLGTALAEWLEPQSAASAAARLLSAGVPAAALASSLDLVASEHLRTRGFWQANGAGVLPGLPWHASFGRRSGDAPALGADTDAVLTEVLGLSSAEIAPLRNSGALG